MSSALCMGRKPKADAGKESEGVRGNSQKGQIAGSQQSEKLDRTPS